MTPILDPVEMTSGERLAEVSALLAVGYRRLLAASKRSERCVENVPQISQTSPSIRLGLLPEQSD